MERVLVFSGLDPSGGAGIVADIETINQFNVTPLPIVTTLTAQNTATVAKTQEVDSGLIELQFNHLKKDIDFAVVKIGLLASDKQIKKISSLLEDKTIVLDPIINSSTKEKLLDIKAIKALKKHLLPKVTALTPNIAELHALTGEKNEQKAINALPCEWVLLTTTDVSTINIEHRLYHNKKLVKYFDYPKLPGDYHGSGCTLASGISALLALGLGAEIACSKALDYTYQSLLNAKKIGKAQHHPNRQKPI